MLINSDMTLYHKEIVNHKEKWQRKYIKNVFWTGGHGSNFNQGLADLNDVTVRVWNINNDLSQIEFSQGDILVKGNCLLEINKQSDLSDYKDVYNINSIINNLYGSPEMQHIHLGGK